MPMITRESSAGKRERFGRRHPFENAELIGLFDLLDRQPPGEARIALSLFVRDKLRSLFPQGTKQIATVDLTNGLSVSVDVGDLFGAETFVGHCNEAGILDALMASLPEGAKIVDVGANFGIYSLCAAAVAGVGGGGVAFEPAPTAFGLLQTNIERNGFRPAFTARRAAVGAAVAKAQFHVAADESFSGMRDTGRSPIQETIEIDVTTLDADEDVQALGAITFLKIDTEGGEAGVLMGAQDLIARSGNLAILMEYSAKNLTAEQAESVRVALRATMKRGFNAWVIEGDSGVAPLTSVDSLPDGFNGSIFLAARGAAWAQAFLEMLRSSRLTSSIDAASVTAAVTSLILNARQANQNLGLLRSAADKLNLSGEGLIADRVIKRMMRVQSDLEGEKAQNQEFQQMLKDAADLQRRTAADLEACRSETGVRAIELRSLRADIELLSDKDSKKNAAIADLNRLIAERSSDVKSLKAQLGSISEEFDATKEKLITAREMLAQIKQDLSNRTQELSAQSTAFDKYRRHAAAKAERMAALLEERRVLIRQLQQTNGLLILGKLRRS